MSKDRIRVCEDIENLVEYLSRYSPLVTVETKYLKQEKPIVVLRFTGSDLPSHVEAVRLTHMGVAPVMKRERFCWCDGVSSLILYDDEDVPVEEGIEILNKYVRDVVQGEYGWEEFEDEHLVE
jgi:hypothetical protein